MKAVRYIVALLSFLFAVPSFALETLDVLIVYDGDSLPSHLSTETQRAEVAKAQIRFLNRTMENTSIQNQIRFQLKKQLVASIRNNTETYEQIYDRYRKSMDSSRKKIALYNLNKLQKEYQADVVVAVMNHMQYPKCGEALHIPDTNYKKYGFSSIQEYQSFADIGIVFIASRENCINDVTNLSHEVGHSFGLYHGKEVDGADSNPEAFPSAFPYVWEVKLPAYQKIGTIMLSGYQRQAGLTEVRNMFSNIANTQCGGTFNNQPCGSTYQNEAAIITSFAPSYNKRGNWFMAK